MTMLHLDYQRGIRLFPWAGAFLLVIGLAGTAWTAVYYRGLSGEIAYWEDRAERRAPRTGLSAERRETKETAQEINYVNGVLNKLTLPWDKMFQAVEWSAGREVALLGMEPDAEKHEVKISAEAKNLAAMTRYLRELSGQEIFSSVYLQNHQVQQQMREKPVRFTLIASWKAVP